MTGSIKMLLINICLLPGCLLLAQPALAQAAAETAVDALFAAQDKPDSPGCAVAVIRDGKIIYQRGYGQASLEFSVPITPATVFNIGSISKQFAAASVALLAAQGRLSLDDDIRKYFPELPDYGAVITVRHLIHHTSGLRDYIDLIFLSGAQLDSVYTDQEIVNILARQQALNFKPGEQFSYCNSGYVLLGLIVEKVSGKTLRQFAEENFFRPLGMNNTVFLDDRKMVVRNRASGYMPKAGGGFTARNSAFDRVGDGGLLTTVGDFFRWDQNFYSASVGGRELIERLQTPGRFNNGQSTDYAFGLRTGRYRGLKTVGHNGSIEGFRADYTRFPEQNFSVICLCNLGSLNPTGLAKKIADIYLAEQLKAAEPASPVAKVPASALQEKAGLYRDPQTGETLKVTFAGDRLTLARPDFSFALTPVNAEHFRVASELATLDVRFTRSDSGWMLQVANGNQPPVTYRPFQPVTLSLEQLREYAGEFFSEELPATYRLELKDGKLNLTGTRAPVAPLTPTVTDEFTTGSWVIRFRRDAQKQISGFTLSTGRVRNLAFSKRHSRGQEAR